MATYTATMAKLTKTFSQEAYDRYVAKEVRAMSKARAQGHRDFATWTDEEIQSAAVKLAQWYNAGEVWQ